MSTGSAGEPAFPRDRRFIFVQLLFSLTAAEIARQGAELTHQGRGVLETMPAYSHLVLALIVVASSWVGWSMSKASLRLNATSVFSWPFVALLADVLLVIFYFVLVRGAEIPKIGDPLRPSARIECEMIAAIFVGYFHWDVLTKAVVLDADSGASKGFLKRMVGRAFWKRGVSSFFCMLLGIASWYFLRTVSSWSGVILVDVSLFSLVLLFRALKEEKPWVYRVPLFLAYLGLGIAAHRFG
jgi:hypothetical protein